MGKTNSVTRCARSGPTCRAMTRRWPRRPGGTAPPGTSVRPDARDGATGAHAALLPLLLPGSGWATPGLEPAAGLHGVFSTISPRAKTVLDPFD